MEQKKKKILTIFLILLLVFVLFLYENFSTFSKTGASLVVSKEQEDLLNIENNKIKSILIKDGLNYKQAIDLYGESKNLVVIDGSCGITTSYRSFKRSDKIMIDNRSAVGRNITIGLENIFVDAYDFKFFTLDDSQTIAPVSCDNKSVAFFRLY